MLKLNKFLKELNLIDNYMGIKGTNEINKCIESNYTLYQLILDNNTDKSIELMNRNKYIIDNKHFATTKSSNKII